jgi:hypothetical protein
MSFVLGAVQWSQGVQDSWSKIATFVPKFVGFLVILIVGYFIAKVIGKALDKVLDRVGFDKAVERGGIAKAMSKSQYDASDLVSKVAFYALFLLVLQAAFGVFGSNPISDLLRSVIAYLPKVIAAIVIVVVASAIATAIREVVDASLGGLSYGKTLGNAAGVVVIALGAFAALNQLQIAQPIVNGLFYAILASVVGVVVIAVGGGGIKPMQARWENTLQKYDAEKPKVQEQMQSASQRIDVRARERAAQAQGLRNANGSGVNR